MFQQCAGSFVQMKGHMTMRIMMRCENVRHKNVSIGLCPGVAWGAWKHAPIIPLPNYHALILHAHPIFV